MLDQRFWLDLQLMYLLSIVIQCFSLKVMLSISSLAIDMNIPSHRFPGAEDRILVTNQPIYSSSTIEAADHKVIDIFMWIFLQCFISIYLSIVRFENVIYGAL